MQFTTSNTLIALSVITPLSYAATVPLVPRGLIPQSACAGKGDTSGIKGADFQALAVAINSNSLSSGKVDDWIYIPHSSAVQFKSGSMQACVHNDYLFDNSHYSRTVIADAIAASYIDCCKDMDTCDTQPWTTIKGDSGLQAVVSIMAADQECKSVNGNGKGYLSAAEVAGKTGKLFWDIFKSVRL